VHTAGSHNTIGHKADVHLGGHHADADGGVDTLGIFNMPTIMAFITWFGGAGYIFSRALPVGDFVLLLMALASGLLGGAIMFLILSRLFWPAMSKPLSRADFSLPGTPARVVSPIREGGTGEIVYTKSGTRFTSGARSVNQAPVEKGTEVVILNYEHGIAYVQPVQEILDRTVETADSV
jgi:membrane protein implicated in regulation of membrane protease activity